MKSICPALALIVAFQASTASFAATTPDFVVRMAEASFAKNGLGIGIATKAQFIELFGSGFFWGYTSGGVSETVFLSTPNALVFGEEAGKAHRQTHTNTADQVFAGYGYSKIISIGSWSTAFEISSFRPDGTPNTELWWLDGFNVKWPELSPAEKAESEKKGRWYRRTIRVKITGYSSPVGSYGHMGLYKREIKVTHIELNPAETEQKQPTK